MNPQHPIRPDSPLPPGATRIADGVNFNKFPARITSRFPILPSQPATRRMCLQERNRTLNAAQLIGEIGIAVATGLTAHDLAAFCDQHPMASEGISKAARTLF
jgi:hypothetical protein